MTTLPLTKKDLIPFTPERENAPTYLIGVATGAGRAHFNRSLNEEGSRFISDSDLLSIVQDGVREVMAESKQEEILALIEEFKDTPLEERTEEQIDRISAIEDQIRPHYQPYATVTAARTYHMEIMPLVAARCFLRGIENGVKYQAKSGFVTDECLEKIPEQDMRDIGWKALALMNLSEGIRKNSESPLPSPASPETSAAAE